MLKEYDKVLVTGGLGFIGRHLVHKLISLGKEVTILDNSSSAMVPSPPPGASLLAADVRDQHEVLRALAGVDLVFHVAANANGTMSVTNPRLDFEINALGTFYLAEAATLASVRRFVYISSASVYGRPQYFPMDEEHPTRPFVPYGASKLAGELACLSLHHSRGLPVVIGRPFCAYGVGENPQLALVEVARYLRWHLNGQPIQVVGDPSRKTRDFVHIRDLVSGLLLIADRAEAGEIFNVGSGTEVSMRQLVETIASVTGQTVAINEISAITNDTYRLVADITKLRSLSYRPSTSLHEGVRELAEHLGNRPELPSGSTIFAYGQQAEH